MSLDSLSAELSRLCPGGVRRNISLAKLSRWRIGGVADVVVEPGSVDELSRLRRFIAHEGLASVVIGDTSNLLFSDEGLRAICIKIGVRLSSVRIEGTHVTAEAGIWVPYLARQIQKAGLTGAEHICGIPGTLGGLICMNGGSQRKGIGSAVVTVDSVDVTGAIRHRAAEDCGFAYRRSIFQTTDEIITAAHLHLTPRSSDEIRTEMRTILADRRRKFPRKEPNCGSVFKSNPAMYAEVGPPGAAIERLGFKGHRIGDAMVSQLHANFFVNVGSASAIDMLQLIAQIGAAVEDATGYRMEAEARFVRVDGTIQAADACHD